MTNAETITKLNNALQTLIKAYEELQGDNNNLKQKTKLFRLCFLTSNFLFKSWRIKSK